MPMSVLHETLALQQTVIVMIRFLVESDQEIPVVRLVHTMQEQMQTSATLHNIVLHEQVNVYVIEDELMNEICVRQL